MLATLHQVAKVYTKGQHRVTALDGIDLDIQHGQFLSLMGPSGSGKSTLLQLLGGLDVPTSGAMMVAESRLDRMNESQLTAWRAKHVGFIFQQYHLIPVLTAAQNVEMPLRLFNMTRSERRQRVQLALEIVGLADRTDHRPNMLSGGQEQRVAIARALVTDPSFLLADEPTGDLDAENATEILNLLQMLNRDYGKSIVMVTHDPKAAAYAGRNLHLEKGQIVGDRTASAVAEGGAA